MAGSFWEKLKPDLDRSLEVRNSLFDSYLSYQSLNADYMQTFVQGTIQRLWNSVLPSYMTPYYHLGQPREANISSNS